MSALVHEGDGVADASGSLLQQYAARLEQQKHRQTGMDKCDLEVWRWQ